MSKIPFNRPGVAGTELGYIEEAIARAELAGGGHFTTLCQDTIKRDTGAALALLTHSCTAALEMTAILADLKPGDEVIMPSFTFVSTANAVVLRGAVPVFVDVRADTLNIDETLIESAITSRTKAIVVVHYAGVPCEMNAINDIARTRNLIVIEDAAQAYGSSYEGRPAGGLADMSAFSFHETKNIISGEGGALAIRNESFCDRAEIIWQKGTNRRQFLRGMVDKYSWVDIGSSFLPSELIAAYLYGQLKHCETILNARMELWRYFERELSILQERGYRLPVIPQNVHHNAHLFRLIAPNCAIRDELILRMRTDGIETPFHYVPLHSAPAGRKYCRTGTSMDVTDSFSSRLLRLPLYQEMGDERHRIVERVLHHTKALDNKPEAGRA